MMTFLQVNLCFFFFMSIWGLWSPKTILQYPNIGQIQKKGNHFSIHYDQQNSAFDSTDAIAFFYSEKEKAVSIIYLNDTLLVGEHYNTFFTPPHCEAIQLNNEGIYIIIEENRLALAEERSITRRGELVYRSTLKWHLVIFDDSEEILSIYQPKSIPTFSKAFDMQILLTEDTLERINISNAQHYPRLKSIDSIGKKSYTISLHDFFCSEEFDLSYKNLYIQFVTKGGYILAFNVRTKKDNLCN
ncbi:MAG: hypothetical protein AAGI38_00735 [Bacteroidota bacterium]